jgi:parallel beta-helix repeat protein
MKRIVVLLVLLTALPTLFAQGRMASAEDCVDWSGSPSIQSFVSANVCVRVLPGTYFLSSAVIVPAGHTLTGVPGERASTVLAAGDDFPLEPGSPLGSSTLVAADGVGSRVVAHLTLNGRERASRIVCCNNLTLDNVRVIWANCDGIDINGSGVTVSNSEIAYNAQNSIGQGICNSAAAPYGGGIYVQPPGASVVDANPQIINNEIHSNFGMGIDVNGGHYGTIRSNRIYDNAGPAGISLYGASYWTVTDNSVSQSYNAPPAQNFHPACNGGPVGYQSAAISICQDTDVGGFYSIGNDIQWNGFAGGYGILSIGNDEAVPYWAPRGSTFANNTVTGSYFGCADDFRPGQWFADTNVWSNNNCAGAYGTPPTYF